MKRLRYAAGLVEPADDEMEGIACYAKELQTHLGEHHDAIVAANFLAMISEEATGRLGRMGSPTESWWPTSGIGRRTSGITEELAAQPLPARAERRRSPSA
jgi:CHAD domain